MRTVARAKIDVTAPLVPDALVSFQSVTDLPIFFNLSLAAEACLGKTRMPIVLPVQLLQSNYVIFSGTTPTA